MSALVAEVERRAEAAAAPLQRDVAVVDVGSNSVRLVVYRLEGRAIWTVFNEKVLAGLGRDLAATGRLNPEGVTAAMAALRRFKAVLDAVRPAEVFTAATAAVREASDGPAFVARVLADTGLTIRVLSGPEEARFAALGVIAGAPSAEGLVGDLGGSSLELTLVDQGRVGAGLTLPLGPFALGASGPFDAARVASVVGRRLARLDSGYRSSSFHAVGGAWRNLALLQMRMTAYPLRIVHGYAMTAREALDAARFVARQSKASLERIQGMSKKRIETLPYAAVVLEGLIERLGIERVEVSAFGVREGLLFESMSEAVRDRDPLIEGCAALGARHGMAEHLGPALEDWLADSFDALEPVLPQGREPVLRAAAARLADVGARLHPDHRAELVFDQVLRAPVTGQSHSERAFLAVAAYARYGGADALPDEVAAGRLLTPDQLTRARALGACAAAGLRPVGPQPGAARPLDAQPGLGRGGAGSRPRLGRHAAGRADPQTAQRPRRRAGPRADRADRSALRVGQGPVDHRAAEVSGAQRRAAAEPLDHPDEEQVVLRVDPEPRPGRTAPGQRSLARQRPRPHGIMERREPQPETQARPPPAFRPGRRCSAPALPADGSRSSASPSPATGCERRPARPRSGPSGRTARSRPPSRPDLRRPTGTAGAW
jgi:exopolyphosphatase/guanosine-5'-triphosphate,3'-diphosphate pyrophosphatase